MLRPAVTGAVTGAVIGASSEPIQSDIFDVLGTYWRVEMNRLTAFPGCPHKHNHNVVGRTIADETQIFVVLPNALSNSHGVETGSIV